MGLAASQARLLTITSRKSRAQFESMRLSHQKLALSRNLTELSNAYQNSLDQTKLYYDFYGVNSTDNPLTYGLLMSPSSINDYTPTLLSNNQGQIILSSPYAAAARAAGIPQEGLGCTPSSLMREAFVLALAENNVITQATANSINLIGYNQAAGLGGDNLVNTITETGSYEELMTLLRGGGNTDGVTLEGLLDGSSGNGTVPTVITGTRNGTYSKVSGGGTWSHNVGDSGKGLESITFADLITGDQEVLLMIESEDNAKAHNWWNNYENLVQSVKNVYTAMGDTLISILDGDSNVVDAVAYANDQMQTMCWEPSATPPTGDEDKFWDFDFGGLFGDDVVEHEANWYTQSIPSGNGKESKEKHSWNKAVDNADDYMALINVYRSRTVVIGNRQEDVGAIDLTNFTKAWFTYFMQYMVGLGTPEANQWYINWRDKVDNQSFADKDSIGNFKFTFTTTTVSDNEALIANFYDTLFNQICLNGWNENDKVATDSNYLKEMLQNGMMYITSMSDDYYYYQNNYSTNNFIKEVSDDAAIAQAESKYTTEKARINAKEQELDLKMKNLDTEISSLETEYEAVKKVIEGNVSKSFTRYDS